MLVSISSGGPIPDAEYKSLREELLKEPILGPNLPRFIHTCRDRKQFWNFIQTKYSTYKERREYIWSEFKDILSILEGGNNVPGTEQLSNILANINSSTVYSAWQTAYQRRSNDPEGALTSARTLLESTCKFILDKQQITYSEKEDLPKLYKMASESLSLAPSQHQEPIFKQILGGCHAVVDGLSSLRNKLGDAHGKGGNYVKPTVRHSELAVNLAGSLASFLIATFEESIKKPVGPTIL